MIEKCFWLLLFNRRKEQERNSSRLLHFSTLDCCVKAAGQRGAKAGWQISQLARHDSKPHNTRWFQIDSPRRQMDGSDLTCFWCTANFALRPFISTSLTGLVCLCYQGDGDRLPAWGAHRIFIWWRLHCSWWCQRHETGGRSGGQWCTLCRLPNARVAESQQCFRCGLH